MCGIARTLSQRRALRKSYLLRRFSSNGLCHSSNVMEHATSKKEAKPSTPLVIGIDLDDTLWRPEMYLCYGAPFRKRNSKVYDCSGEEIKLLRDSREILEMLHTSVEFSDTRVAYVSRTEYPEWANEVIPLMPISKSVTMEDVGDAKLHQIYPGDKQAHFKEISRRSEVALSDMLFFDNEYRNVQSVSRLGVTSIYTPEGLTMELFRQGLSAFKRRND